MPEISACYLRYHKLTPPKSHRLAFLHTTVLSQLSSISCSFLYLPIQITRYGWSD